ncbi:DUF3140 domain-containing protein [Nocardiopsis algeriensis]|uniref:DUF3140 domain-containing protein n=1 Tax=Nocardiopsis algeriensis TaxID=1478215 RepID=A0A841IZY1_9ACTN|nr:DUF3140 domain-containing protein [Nocardiopsis algeriensis]MBB6121818.1 hypothetical protein [Nocardiopsis algeriensis]
MAEYNERLDEVWDSFHTVVNMNSEELREWLLTEASGETAFDASSPDLGVPRRGEEIVEVLGKRRTDVTDDDVDLMEDVTEFVRSRLVQPRREDPEWRRELMSVGHDPLRPDSVRPDEEDL